MPIHALRAALSLTLCCCVLSCGYIYNKDRIRIATLNGKPITRGDFDKVIRDMAPDQRPMIRTKGDVRRALENYLDEQVRNINADRLLAQNKIHVPRELAENLYRYQHPEAFIEISNPEDYNLNQRDLEYMKEEREIKIDELLKKLQAEAGIQYRIEQAMKEGLMSISDEEYQREYELRATTLKHFERIAFTGLLIPGESSEARSAGIAAKQKLAAGVAPEDLAAEFASLGAQVLESELENDPQKVKYKSFWEQAEGRNVGEVIGPMYIQGWVAVETDAIGRSTQKPYPDGILVAVVTGRTDESPKSLEESKPDLQYNILYTKIMDQLRSENGVQIFEDKLPDPGMYDTTVMQ